MTSSTGDSATCGLCGMVWLMTQTIPATQEAAAWVPDDSTFGARLALIRQRMGWNIAEAARECGVNTESWRLWEQAGREPRQLVTICMAIATRTGVDVDWLIKGPSAASLRARAELTVWYARDVINPPKVDTSVREGRVVAQVGHGDFRRKPSGGTSNNHVTGRDRQNRQTPRPVSRATLA